MLILVDVLVMRPLLERRLLSRDAAVLLALFLLVLPLTLALASVFTDRVDATAVRLARFVAGLTDSATIEQSKEGACWGAATARALAAGVAGNYKEVGVWVAAYAALVAVALVPSPHGDATCTDREFWD